MANRTRQDSTRDCKRSRCLSNIYNDHAPVQCKWRWYQMMRCHFKMLLVLLGFFIVPILEAASSPSIDYGSLTWSKWNEIYALAGTDSVRLREIYRSGPRVRAKILVSTHISMNELREGEAIFRQQIREIVQVETIDRVQMEYLQTEAYSETEQGAYYVAMGISALPPPQSSGISYGSSIPVLMLPAIEIERERIAESLRFGKLLATGNMTIDSLTLFGVPMRLVDIVLDGESFSQIYLTPWLGVQLVVASTQSVSLGISSSTSDHYTITRNPFQDLRLRFLLALQLTSLQIRVSDIIVHSPTTLLPFSIYNADAGVLEIEIHVHDMEYAGFVERYLLSDNNSSKNVIAETFNAMEPLWNLIALDVNIDAGQLFSPVTVGNDAPVDSDVNDNSSIELTFEMYNISLMQLERTKWSVLEFVRVTLAPVVSCRVKFGRIDFPSSSFVSSLAIYNDGGGDGAVTEDGFTTDSILDPINAINWTLSFKVEPETTNTFDSVMFANHITSIRSTVETGLLRALGFIDPTDSTTRSSMFQGASDWTDSDLNDADTSEPYVSFTLTIEVEPLTASGTILESPNIFQLHHVRSALVLLLQQVAIFDKQISMVSAHTVDRPTKLLNSWLHLLFFKYRAIISDESQRRGIRSVVFSHRLASTISLYSGRTLKLVERKIDLHADGSPTWPQHLPGVFDVVPKDNYISDGFVTSSTPLIVQEKAFVYNFNDPEASPASGTIVDATDVCTSTGTTSTSGAGPCIKLRFTGTIHVAPILLHTLQSLNPITSSSVRLPPANAALYDASSTYEAPWVLVGNQSNDGETLWTFRLDRSSSSSKYDNIRLTFEAVDNMQDMSPTMSFTLDLELDTNDLAAVPVVRRHQFGDLAVVATTDPPEPAFIFADLPDLTNNGIETTSVSVTLHLDEPRLGGLYSASLLTEVAPACSECTALLATCNDRLECRAFSACTSVLLDADLTLISTMLHNDAVGTSVDASWLLENCLSPSDGTMWSHIMSEILVSSYKCMWQKHCPLAYSNALNRQLVLEYAHGEQVLQFELVNGFASLSFTLAVGEGESTYEFVEDFSTNATTVTTQLDVMLTDMYRDALSNVAMVESALNTDASNDVVTAHLTIHYLFLGRLPLPFVEITQSGNSNITSVDVTTPKEALNLRVISIN